MTFCNYELIKFLSSSSYLENHYKTARTSRVASDVRHFHNLRGKMGENLQLKIKLLTGKIQEIEVPQVSKIFLQIHSHMHCVSHYAQLVLLAADSILKFAPESS